LRGAGRATEQAGGRGPGAPRGVGRRGLRCSTGAVTSSPAGLKNWDSAQSVKGEMPSSATRASMLAYCRQNLSPRRRAPAPPRHAPMLAWWREAVFEQSVTTIGSHNSSQILQSRRGRPTP